jgi:hypothetical protein
MVNQKRNRFLFPFLDLLLLFLLVGYVFLGFMRAPFHGDESTFIRMSLDWVYLTEDHAPEKVFFHSGVGFHSEEQSQRILIGSINPLSIGFSWSISGITREEINGFWKWDSTDGDEWINNARLGNIPDIRLLNIARIPSTLFTSGSIVCIFIISLWLIKSRPAAWIAALVYATTPSILINGRRAMQEGAMLFFTLLLVLCAIYTIRSIHEVPLRLRRVVPGFMFMGLFSGLSVASKHSAVLIIIPAYAVFLLIIWFVGKEKDPLQKTEIQFCIPLSLIGSAFLGLATFYIFSPIWWQYGWHWMLLLCFSSICFLFSIPISYWWLRIARLAPIVILAFISLFATQSWKGIYEPLQFGIQARNDLTPLLFENVPALPTIKSRLDELAKQLLTAKTQYYENYCMEDEEKLISQINIYEEWHLDGRGGGATWGIVISILIITGILGNLKRWKLWESFFLIAWLLIPSVILLITNPFIIQRYYILLIAPWSVLAGFAAVPFTSPEFWKRIRMAFAKKS